MSAAAKNRGKPQGYFWVLLPIFGPKNLAVFAAYLLSITAAQMAQTAALKRLLLLRLTCVADLPIFGPQFIFLCLDFFAQEFLIWPCIEPSERDSRIFKISQVFDKHNFWTFSPKIRLVVHYGQGQRQRLLMALPAAESAFSDMALITVKCGPPKTPLLIPSLDS